MGAENDHYTSRDSLYYMRTTFCFAYEQVLRRVHLGAVQCNLMQLSVTHGSKIEKKYGSQTLIDKGISEKYEKKWEFIVDDMPVMLSTD